MLYPKLILSAALQLRCHGSLGREPPGMGLSALRRCRSLRKGVVAVAQIVDVTRDGRLVWPDRVYDLPSSELPAEPPRLHRWRNIAVAVTVVLYLLFNWGFQQVRVPPGTGFALPVGEIVLIGFLMTLNYTRVLGKLGGTIALLPFSIWWAFGLSRAVFDAMVHDEPAWALRDAVHVIESLFLIVGFVFASHPKTVERFVLWAPRILFIGTAYALMYPFTVLIQSFSPEVMTQHGNPAAIIGVMINSPYWGIITAVYLILFHGHRFWANLLAAVLLGAMVAMFQARTIYLVLAAVFLFLTVYRRGTISNTVLLAVLGIFMMGLIVVLDIRIDGRLGQSFSPAFLIGQIKAIVGWCDPTNYQLSVLCSAASGVDQRLDWWWSVYDRMMANPFYLLLGLGYGILLTDFAPGGIPVRELHNSYITIFARTGVIGGIAWFAMMAVLFLRWRSIFRHCRRLGWREGENWMLLLMCFFIAMWVYAMGEDGFEKPYNVIPFYFLWGVVLQFGRLLDARVIGPKAHNSGEDR
jgi:hypothetical protein